ncbi:MAG: response regulator [Chloroflexota bacterium]|nr:response regulator [Chloroflexota bacterium]
MMEGKIILVVEDERNIVELVSEVLADEGYQVMTARDGQEGLDRVAETVPDLILSDVMMPVLDGRAMGRALQSDPVYQDIPLVLMSAVSENALDAEDLSYHAFLSKPFELDTLVETINRLVV